MIELRTFSEYPDPNRPRRLRKYVLVWCSKGTVMAIVDQKELRLRRHQVLTITSGQIHSFEADKNAEGSILEFTLDFFCKNDNDIELIFQNGLFCHFDLNEIISLRNHDVIEMQLSSIRDELSKKPFQYLTSIHSRIELILVSINRAKVERGDEIWK